MNKQTIFILLLMPALAFAALNDTVGDYALNYDHPITGADIGDEVITIATLTNATSSIPINRIACNAYITHAHSGQIVQYTQGRLDTIALDSKYEELVTQTDGRVFHKFTITDDKYQTNNNYTLHVNCARTIVNTTFLVRSAQPGNIYYNMLLNVQENSEFIWFTIIVLAFALGLLWWRVGMKMTKLPPKQMGWRRPQ